MLSLVASLSHQPTAVSSAPAEPHKLAQHDSGIHMPELTGLSKQATEHDTPFSVEELEQAMTRATLRPRDFGENEARVGQGRRIGISS